MTDLEKRINAEYTKAYKELKKEIAELANGGKTSKLARLEDLANQMAGVLQNTNKVATDFIEKSLVNTFMGTYNKIAGELGFALLDSTAVRNILTGEVNPFTRLSIAAEKDKSVIIRNLTSELTTGILKGESITDMAARLKNVSEGYLKDTIRIARTETTRVENSAKQSVGNEGKRRGLNMWKRWVATPDPRTRDSHMAADGQEVPNDEPFTVGGEKMMYPGDISFGADVREIVNCRCTIINFIKHE